MNKDIIDLEIAIYGMKEQIEEITKEGQFWSLKRAKDAFSPLKFPLLVWALMTLIFPHNAIVYLSLDLCLYALSYITKAVIDKKYAKQTISSLEEKLENREEELKEYQMEFGKNNALDTTYVEVPSPKEEISYLNDFDDSRVEYEDASNFEEPAGKVFTNRPKNRL